MFSYSIDWATWLLQVGVDATLHCIVQIDEDEPCPLECVRQIYKGEVYLSLPRAREIS